MRYSALAIAALLLPPPALMVQACDTTAQGVLSLDREDEAFCHPWPSCTSWTGDTVRQKNPKKVAQQEKQRGMDELLGDFDLSSGEFVRLDLEAGEVYRVEFNGRSSSLQVRPRRSSTQPLLPLRVEDIPRASGTHALEIVPREDGEYEFRLLGGNAKLRVYHEITPSQRWQRLARNEG